MEEKAMQTNGKTMKVLRALWGMFKDLLRFLRLFFMAFAIIVGGLVISYCALERHEVIAMALFYPLVGISMGFTIILVCGALLVWFDQHYKD